MRELRRRFALLPLLCAIPFLTCISCTSAEGPSQTGAAREAAPAGVQTPDDSSTEGSADRAALEKGYADAKAAHEAAPTDTALTSAFVESTVKLGTAYMTAPDLGPKDKYPAALRYYREALALNPTHEDALKNAKMIEEIYQSMGRPIPE